MFFFDWLQSKHNDVINIYGWFRLWKSYPTNTKLLYVRSLRSHSSAGWLKRLLCTQDDLFRLKTPLVYIYIYREIHYEITLLRKKYQKLSTKTRKAMAKLSFSSPTPRSFIWFTCGFHGIPQNSQGKLLDLQGKLWTKDEMKDTVDQMKPVSPWFDYPLLFTESFLRTWNLFVFYFGSWLLQKKVISGPVIVHI